MTADQLFKTFRQPAGYSGKLAAGLLPSQSRQRSNWTVEQLDIQPYQHILEIGYGSGYTLQEVARKLKIGFLAGIDQSTDMYKQAYRRNKKYIQQQLLQLHLGSVNELSYPPHYFHTIYGLGIHFFRKETSFDLIRLAGLLKNGGKLVMVFQPQRSAKEESIALALEKIRENYLDAGLTGVSIEYRDMYPVTCISATGFKP